MLFMEAKLASIGAKFFSKGLLESIVLIFPCSSSPSSLIKYLDGNGSSTLLNMLTAYGVDIAILKNCVLPMTSDEKSDLRKKYEIDDSRPVVVVSYPNLNCRPIVEELSDIASVKAANSLASKSSANFPIYIVSTLL